MKKLEKILKLSAYTLLCTSSIMAAFGENMAAGVGVTVGTSVQEQTYLDNSTDGSSGPLAGVHGNALMRFADNGSSVTMFDIKTAAYPRLDTYSGGLGLVYRMKSAGGLGQGFSAAVDYTRYDNMDAWQAALGHETMLSGFDSRFNVYIPFGDTYTYNADSGSKLTTMLGADWTLTKAIDAVNLGGHMSYFYNDDVKDNIFSIGMVGDYTFDKSVTIGAGVQYRDGLDSGDWGYRGFAAVPLFKGQTSSKNTEIYRPVARMLGAVIQAEEEDCSGQPGTESFARYGLTTCLATNPFDAAQIKSAAALPKSGIDAETLRSRFADGDISFAEGTKFTAKKGKLHFVDRPVVVDKAEFEAGSHVSFGKLGAIIVTSKNSDGKDLIIGKGDFDVNNHPVIFSQHSHTFRNDKGKFGPAMKFLSKGRARTTGSLADESLLDHKDSNEPRLGLIVLGKGDLNFSADAELGEGHNKAHIIGEHLDGFKVTTAAATATPNKGVMKATDTGRASKIGKKLKDHSFGGGTALTLAKVDKLLSLGVPIRTVGFDVDMRNSRIASSRFGGLHQRGGKVSIQGSHIFASHRNSGHLIDLDGGGLTQIFGSIINGTRLPADKHHIRLRNSSAIGGDSITTTANDYLGNTGLISLRNDFKGHDSEGGGAISFANGPLSGGYLLSISDHYEQHALLAKKGGNDEEAVTGTAGTGERIPSFESSHFFEPSNIAPDSSNDKNPLPLVKLEQKNNATAASSINGARFIAHGTTLSLPDNFRDRIDLTGPTGAPALELTLKDVAGTGKAVGTAGTLTTSAQVGHFVGATVGPIDELGIFDAALVGTASGGDNTQFGVPSFLADHFNDLAAVAATAQAGGAGSQPRPGIFSDTTGAVEELPGLFKKSESLETKAGAPTEIARAQFKTNKHKASLAVQILDTGVVDIAAIPADGIATTRPTFGLATTDHNFTVLDKIVGNEETQLSFIADMYSNGKGGRDEKERVRKNSISHDDKKYTAWKKKGLTTHDDTHDTHAKLVKKRKANRYKDYHTS